MLGDGKQLLFVRSGRAPLHAMVAYGIVVNKGPFSTSGVLHPHHHYSVMSCSWRHEMACLTGTAAR